VQGHHGQHYLIHLLPRRAAVSVAISMCISVTKYASRVVQLFALGVVSALGVLG